MSLIKLAATFLALTQASPEVGSEGLLNDSYVLHPHAPIAVLGESGRSLGLPQIVSRVDASYWRAPCSDEEYHRALSYALEMGLEDEGAARLAIPTLLFMSDDGLRHHRVATIGKTGTGFRSATQEELLNGSTLTRYLTSTGGDLESTFTVRSLDGTSEQGNIDRWAATDNRFLDLPLDVGELLMHQFAVASLLLECEGYDGGPISLSGDLIQRISENGALGSVSRLGHTAVVSKRDAPKSGSCVLVDWFDRNGLLLLRHSVSWLPGVVAPFPVQVDVEEYVLGGAELIARKTFRVAAGDERQLTVKDVSGRQLVIDRRFGEVARYSSDAVEFDDRAAAAAVSANESLLRSIGEFAAIASVVGDGALPADSAISEDLLWQPISSSDGENPSAALTPALRRYSPRPIGSRVPVVFEIHNLTESPLEVRSVEPDCGCIQVTSIPKSIAAGAVYEFRGTQEVLSVGPVRKKVKIELENGSGEVFQAIAFTEVDGLPAMLSTYPAYELSRSDDGLYRATLTYAFEGCASPVFHPNVKVGIGPLRSLDASWLFGEVFAEGSLQLQASRVQKGAGAFIQSIDVRGPLCSDAPPGAAVLFGTMPAAGYTSWPRCWAVVSAGDADLSIQFPMDLKSVKLDRMSAHFRGVFSTLRVEGKALHLSLDVPCFVSGLCGLSLDTEAGAVQVYVAVVTDG
jgi:hypothetical protein